MPWAQLSHDLREFAEQLYKEENTQQTANGLFAVFGHLDQMWRSRREMSVTQGIPLPCPRKKGLHPQNSDVVDAEIRFAFELGDEWEVEHLPKRADFQVKVLGKLALNNCVVELEDHWRVDSHIFPPDPPLTSRIRISTSSEGATRRTSSLRGALRSGARSRQCWTR